MRSIKVFPDNDTALVVLSLRHRFLMPTCLMQAATKKSQINTLLYLFPFLTQGFCDLFFFVADSGAMECLSLLNTFPQDQENS